MKKNKLTRCCILFAMLLMVALSGQAQHHGALQYMLQKRPANEKFEHNQFNEHLFFSAGMGVQHLLTNQGSQDGLGMESMLYIGKWLTPVHGLRIGGGLGYLPSRSLDGKIKMGRGGLDYLLNVSSLALGYNENRFFELTAIAGVELGVSHAIASNDLQKFLLPKKYELFYGTHLGLQGNFRLGRTLDLFVEPTLGWYNDRYDRTETWRNYKIKGALMMGVTYMPAAPMGKRIHFDEFDNRSFVNHFFLSVYGGVGMLKVPGIKNSMKGGGPQLSAAMGKWFSPFSALRLSGTLGYLDAPAGSVSNYFKHLDLHADYMFHLNNLFWGYDEQRLFSLIGIAGVNLAATKGVQNKAQIAPGLGVGLQGSFRLNPSVDLFVEPRLNLYHKNYAGAQGLGGNSDQLAELNVGLTYHATDRAKRSQQLFKSRHITDHLFMTSGLGMQLFVNKVNIQHLSSLGPQASVSIGKWLTPCSGIRLVGAGGFFTNYVVPGNVLTGRLRHVSLTAGADYLWNITSTMGGYHPDRIFELIASAGLHMAYTSRSDYHFQPGLNAGIQALWHVNDFLGLYIEPQVRLYGDKFIEGNMGFLGKDMLAGLTAGFHYRFVPYAKAANRAAFSQDEARYFISGALGFGSLFVANKELVKHAGVMAKGGLGKWFTPLSAWRVSGTILYKSKASNQLPLHYAGLGVDYMMSLANLAKGYRADPVIDVLPFMGVTAGLARRNGKFKAVPGLDAGVQVKLKLGSSLYLFAEPQVGIRTDAYDGVKQGRPDRVASMVGGLQLKFKMPKIVY